MFKKFVVVSALITFFVSFCSQQPQQSPNAEAPLVPPQSPILRMLSPTLQFLLDAGCLEIIGGPMASGKSLELMRAINVLQIAGIKTLVCKHCVDTRSSQYLTSRIEFSKQLPAHLITDPNEILELDKKEDYKAIAIDEVQFFPAKTLIPVIKKLLERQKYIIAAGLLYDIRGDAFGCNEKEPLCMKYLRRLATNTLELKAVCMNCKQLPPSATKTLRLVDGKPTSKSDPLIMIDDGTHKNVVYKSCCAHCAENPQDTPSLYFSGAGCFDLIGGPMASGKSIALMRAIKVLQVAGIETLVCKHSIDTRSAECLTSRMNLAEQINAHLIADPQEILELAEQSDYKAIAIDEIQFFPAKTLIPVIKKLLESQKYIIAAGLLSDIRGDAFGCYEKEPLCMQSLRRLATNTLELKAVCMNCKQLPPSATKTERLVGGKPGLKSDPLVMIDDGSHAEVVYESRCDNCYELPE